VHARHDDAAAVGAAEVEQQTDDRRCHDAVQTRPATGGAVRVARESR
jgi:hypothetical protein